jgi:hypothetical protein
VKIESIISRDNLDTIRIHRATAAAITSGIGGQPVRATVQVYEGLACIEHDSVNMLEKSYGDNLTQRWLLNISSDTGMMEEDLIEVRDGRFAGTIMEVDAILSLIHGFKMAKARNTEKVIS